MTSTEEGLWGGLVPVSLLQQALVHKHELVSSIPHSKGETNTNLHRVVGWLSV